MQRTTAAGIRFPAAFSWLVVLVFLAPVAAVAAQPADPIYTERVLTTVTETGDAPVLEETVVLALLQYARTGDAADLALAETLARRMIPEAPPGGRVIGSARPCYRVALAGGETGEQGDQLLAATRGLLVEGERRATTDGFAGIVHDLFARAMLPNRSGALGEALVEAERFFRARMRAKPSGMEIVLLAGGNAAAEASLSDYVETLRLCVAATEATGSFASREVMVRVGHGMIRDYWDDETTRFRAPIRDVAAMPESLTRLLNARASLALMRAGAIANDPFLAERGARVWDSIWSESLNDEVASAAVVLAAAVHGDGARLVVVGDPGNATSAALRAAAIRVADPRRTVVQLDPAFDRDRLETLGIPESETGVLYVERSGVWSEPVTDPAAVAAGWAAATSRSTDRVLILRRTPTTQPQTRTR